MNLNSISMVTLRVTVVAGVKRILRDSDSIEITFDLNV